MFSSKLHWSPGEPGGGRRQNFVAIRTVKKDYDDLEQDTNVCVSCEIARATVFELRGVLKNSYLETQYFPTMCGGYLGFMGNMLSIW